MRQREREETRLLPSRFVKMGQTRVMIVDNDADVREIVKTVLASRGLEVIEAANGHEALEKAELERPSIIILDIMMPEMSGFDVCEKLKVNPLTVNVPVLFLTARDEGVDFERAMSLGALHYFVKPFSPQKLLEKILEITGGH
jgi:two-component system alkaline phosphatase synthesis response regulator PhoP